VSFKAIDYQMGQKKQTFAIKHGWIYIQNVISSKMPKHLASKVETTYFKLQALFKKLL
jgi:hypothetical protein